jgi:hypothetical protein
VGRGRAVEADQPFLFQIIGVEVGTAGLASTLAPGEAAPLEGGGPRFCHAGPWAATNRRTIDSGRRSIATDAAAWSSGEPTRYMSTAVAMPVVKMAMGLLPAHRGLGRVQGARDRGGLTEHLELGVRRTGEEPNTAPVHERREQLRPGALELVILGDDLGEHPRPGHSGEGVGAHEL